MESIGKGIYFDLLLDLCKLSTLLIQICRIYIVDNIFPIAELPPASLKLSLEERFWENYGPKISSLVGRYILQDNSINGFPNWKRKDGIKALWYQKKKWVIGSSTKNGSNTFDVCLPTYDDDIFSHQKIWPHLIFSDWKFKGTWMNFRKWHNIGIREFYIENGKKS